MHAQNQVVPAGPTEPHARPNYLAVYFGLLGLLVVSILLGRIHHPYLMNALVFSVALVKAFLVLVYFMHVKIEPWLVAVILLAAVLCLVALFIGVAPDVMFHGGWK